MKASGTRRTALLLALVVLGGCRTGRNYAASGTVLNVEGASDHLAVWAVGILRADGRQRTVTP